MNNSVRFVTNEQGRAVGVLLGIAEYRRLTGGALPDSEYLTDLNDDEVRALANMRLSASEQLRLDDLLDRNREGQLCESEVAELDRTLSQIDQLSLLKARALYTLQQRNSLFLAA